jgi:lipopolysaccharide/colanic/teichoic acid biosynthesis glycosyltransferase
MPPYKLRAFVLCVSELLLMAGCAWLAAAAYFLDFQFPLLLLQPESRWLLLTMTLTVQAVLGLNGLYHRPLPKSLISLLLTLCQAQGVAFLVAALAVYLHPPLHVAPPLTILFGLISLPALFLWRLLWSFLFWRGADHQRVLFLGADSIARQLAEHFTRHPESGFTVAGFLDQQSPAGTEIAGTGVLGPFSQLGHFLSQSRPNRIVIGTNALYDGLPMDTLIRLRLAGVTVEEAAELYETVFRRVSLESLTPGRLIYAKGLWAQPAGVALQSVWVNLLALALLVILAPLLLLIAAAVKLTSHGPVLESSNCTGFEGLPFDKLAFRCARRPAGGDGGRRRPLTPVGSLLRRLRLDSLPQLFNVLRGEMSLIGPAARDTALARQFAESLPVYQLRHAVKPGILGWAQINLRRAGLPGSDPRLELEYDLYYIKHLSPVIDVYILLHSLTD